MRCLLSFAPGCVAIAIVGCAKDPESARSDGTGHARDLTPYFPDDLLPGPDLAGFDPPNLCGDHDPLCQEWRLGPAHDTPFPMPTDPRPDPRATADGLKRTTQGWLVPTGDRGTYSYVVRGLFDWGNEQPECTRWRFLHFVADVPPGSALTADVRSGPTPVPDGSWGAWTAAFTASPARLDERGVLIPNGPWQQAAYYLQARFTLEAGEGAPRATLKGIAVAFRDCYEGP